MSSRLLESGDELLIEDGTSFRLLEEVVLTVIGAIARWREPSPESWREPLIVSWRDPQVEV